MSSVPARFFSNGGLSATSKIAFLLTLSVAVLACLLPAAPARAQAIRTFVSTAGSNSNPCTITQPCRNFQAAINVTALGGEVDALDPGGYGSFTISQPITIEGQGWSYVAPSANGAAITIAAGNNGNFNIHGVSLNGIGVTNSLGIQFNAGGSLTVRDCVIRNFANDGIDFVPQGAPSQFFVSNTLLSDNGGGGMFVEPSFAGTFTGVLDHVTMQNNGTDGGLSVTSFGQTYNITVTDSVIANNAYGITALVSAGGAATIFVRNSTIVNNTHDGLSATGTGATIRVTRSTITGNGIGWEISSSGVVSSFNDNNILGNTAGNTIPPHVAYE
jgi:hypothetical protein